MKQETISSVIETVRSVARDDIRSNFRQLDNASIYEKSTPMDLVTDVDHRVEQGLTSAFKQLFPSAVIIGEEAVSVRSQLLHELETAEEAVVIDPVDGTWNFANGISTVGVIVAVLKKGVTQFGLLYDPLLDDWVYAVKGAGAFWQNPEGQSRQLHIPPHYRGVGFCSPYLFKEEQRQEVSVILPEFNRVVSFGCSCHEYRAMAMGAADFILTQQFTKPWDHLAGLLVHEEAGGYAANLDDTPYNLTNNACNLLVANSRENWQKLADMFCQ